MELLNNLITSTVSSIFPDPEKHYRLFLNQLQLPILLDKETSRTTLSHLQLDSHGRIYDGSKKLEAAIANLCLTEKGISERNSNFFMSKSVEYLENEKSKVKKELQALDKDFHKQFGRYPEKSEKEIFRLLYVYYKTVKSVLEKKKNSKEEKENVKGGNKNKKDEKRKEELKKEIIILNGEQGKLKERLQGYQVEFLKKNNRKVKYVHDISEVKSEYNKYKDNRLRIKEIENELEKLI